MIRKRIVYPLFLVVLSILILIPSVHLAHAAPPSFVNQVTFSGAGSGTMTLPGLASGAGNMIILIVMENIYSSTPIPTVSDSQGNSYSRIVNIQSNGNIRELWFITLLTSGVTDTIVIHISGGVFPTSVDANAMQFFGATGIGSQSGIGTLPGVGSGTDVQTITIQSNSIVLESASVLNSLVDSCGTISLTGASRYNLCDTFGSIGYGQAQSEHDAQSQGSVSFTMTYSGWNAPAGFIHQIVEVQGAGGVPSSLGHITACYGNCGSPPVTLVNTNSTHSLAFNGSLTIFYEFQSQLNGNVNNVTTSLAKSYNNGQQILIGLYTASCNAGVTPFSASCPGQQQVLQTFLNPVKGTLVINPNFVTVQNQEWVAIAVSGLFTGLDLNDTNTSVNLYQQAPSMPAVLASASLVGASKVGLWAYITGNSQGPPPIISQPSCGADFLCILTNSVLALTPNNPFIGAIFMAFMYSIFTTIGLIFAVGFLTQRLGLHNQGIPNGVFILIWVGWFTFFPSLVGAIWFVVFEIIIVMLLFAAFSGSMLKGSSFGSQTA
jgi:hypothetical protein